jgi:ElaB/YqjD/DUF883 family membrane-anchored ribosome-binding protein
MAQHLFSSLGASADRKLSQLADTSSEKLARVKKKNLESRVRDTKDRLQRNPVKTLAGAAATGALIGWMLRRK